MTQLIAQAKWIEHVRGSLCSIGVAAMLACAPWIVSAQPAAPQKAKAPAQQAAAANKSAATAPVARKGPPRGPIEKFDCKIGTEDSHARIAVLAQGGEVQSVAYYGKWKPRTCSVHLQRGDAYSRWKDSGDATTITTEFGDFLIQTSRAEYQFFFREVDRMHYCGMLGKLNGSMTVTRGPKRECSVVGIMDRNEIESLDAERVAEKSAPPAVPAAPLSSAPVAQAATEQK